jgi:predicted Rossmann fold nucleotide-binding protein DprA/Smf involved in DNA uptake
LLEPRDILEILEQLIVSKKLPEKFYQITIKDAEMAFTEAAKIFSDIDSKNVRISTFLEDSFPLEAVNLENPPAFLYYQGDIRLLKRQKLAIVGTRKPTAFGFKKAQEIAKEAADYKVVVVSGLALGCRFCGP